MQKIKLKKKTGFKNTIPKNRVLILDFRMKPFYDTKLVGDVSFFNLPKGIYYTKEGNFTKMKSPFEFAKADISSRERTLKDATKFKVTFKKNINKCSVFWLKDKIVFDPSFKTKPLYVLFFILFHEFGHRYFRTEHKCDLYATNMMLRRGYNPSQVIAAIQSLSDFQQQRKNIVTHAMQSKNPK